MPLPSILFVFEIYKRAIIHSTRIVISLCLLSGASIGFTDPNPIGITDFSACTIGSDTASLNAQCATVTTSFTYEEGDARTLDLHVAKIPARQTPIQPDPLVLLAGGPGQSATESFPALIHAFRSINENRDLILVDQRGTGNSHRLDCEASVPGEDLEFDSAVVQAHSETCLQAQTLDTRYFTTSIAVKDLEAIRKHLDVELWNIYGISYGTRVAIHYMRRYPEAVRTAILDAVVPPQVTLGADVAVHAQQALEKLYARCLAILDCANAFPQIEKRTQQLLDRLEVTPVSVDYEDVSTGTIRQMELTNKHLAITLRLMTYSAYGVALLPSMLFDAYENKNYAPLARQAMMQTETVGSTIATGLHNAIICTEDAPDQITAAQKAAAEITYLGAEVIDALHANCKPWPTGVMDSDFKEPLVSDIPTIILSGAADPITPASYGDLVASTLTNKLHIVNEHQGHMQMPLGCVPQLMHRLIKSGNVNELDSGCLERLYVPAFFIDANGPKP